IEPMDQPFLEAEGMPTSEVPTLVTSTQIREAMDRLATELEEKNDVYRLVEKHNGFMLMSSPEVGEWIRLLRDEPRPMKLTASALETLAVVAYRQPVVRAEIEKIRGVSVDSALSKLLEREFIMVVGRADLPGRPIQYGTTDEFLDFVGVKSVEELPASDVLSPRQIDEWLHEVSNQPEPTEKDMGLPEGDRPEEQESEDSAAETPDEQSESGSSELEDNAEEVSELGEDAEFLGEGAESEEKAV
ncbi:MAG: SMC-Scp complex subunit ScpB, partial [Verrucomicrobiota bacterium]